MLVAQNPSYFGATTWHIQSKQLCFRTYIGSFKVQTRQSRGFRGGIVSTLSSGTLQRQPCVFAGTHKRGRTQVPSRTITIFRIQFWQFSLGRAISKIKKIVAQRGVHAGAADSARAV